MQERQALSHFEVMDDATAEMLRGKTPSEKLAMAFAMNRTARHLIAGGARWKHPDWSEEEIQQEVVRRMTRGTD